MANKKINQLDNRVGVALTDLSLVGDPTTGTSFKLTIQDISVLMGVPGKFNQPTGTTSQYIRGDGSLATFPAIPSGTVTSVGLTMPSAFSVANSPVTSSGTLTVTGAGNATQYVRGDGQLATFPSLTGFVPYTGATANVDLGTHRILAQNATIASNGSGDTVTLNHTSGSGIGLNITKGGSGEGLYINKTSGSGNAATIIGTLNATTLVKSGGTSSQFLKADGSVDSTTYVGGSGVTGQVAYWNGTNSQTGDNNLFWNSASIRLGIGRTPSARRLEIQVGNGSIASALGLFDGGGSLSSIIGIETVSTNDLQIANVQGIRFYTGSTLGSVVTMPTNERMRLFNTGNLLLQNGGTFTDAGFRLDVNGTARVSGNLTAASFIRSGGTSAQILAADGSVITAGTNITISGGTISASGGGGNTIYTADGTLTSARTLTSGGYNLTFTGSNTASGAIARGLNLTHTLVAAANNDTLVGLDVSPTFTNGSFTGADNIGFRVTAGRVSINTNRTLTFAPTVDIVSNNALFSSKPNHGGVWISQLNNTNNANLTFFNNASSLFQIGVTGSAFGSGMNSKSFILSQKDLFFTTNASAGNPSSSDAKMVLTLAGRLLLGTTTESTFLLDVNGTARVSGAFRQQTNAGSNYFELVANANGRPSFVAYSTACA
jgi:hypothetical protein